MDIIELGVPIAQKVLIKPEAIFKNPNTSYEIPIEVQKKLMNGNAQFIIDLAVNLKQRYTITALAINLCHYFFYKKCYINYDRFIVASSCMLLALKLKDIEGAKMKNICHGYHKIMAKVQKKDRIDILDDDQLQQIREKIIIHENKLLKVINFEFEFPLPIPFIDKIVDKYYKPEDSKKSTKLMSLARIFAIDSYRTYACLVYRSSAIAIACLVIATDFVAMDMPPNIRTSEVDLSKLNQTERIIAEDKLMTNWIKEIDPEATLDDVNSCLTLLKELFETYQNPALAADIEMKDEEALQSTNDPSQMQRDDEEMFKRS